MKNEINAGIREFFSSTLSPKRRLLNKIGFLIIGIVLLFGLMISTGVVLADNQTQASVATAQTATPPVAITGQVPSVNTSITARQHQHLKLIRVILHGCLFLQRL